MMLIVECTMYIVQCKMYNVQYNCTWLWGWKEKTGILGVKMAYIGENVE